MNTIERPEGSKKEFLLSLLDNLSSLLKEAKLKNELSPVQDSLYNKGYIEIFINEVKNYLSRDSVNDVGIERYVESAQKYVEELQSDIERIAGLSSADTNSGPMFGGN